MTDTGTRLASKSIFTQQQPQTAGEDGLSRTWITRGGNLAVCVSQVEPGAALDRQDNPEEYMLIIPPSGASVEVEAGGEVIEAKPDSLTIIPPGSSRIVARTGGLLARVLSRAAGDVMALAVNAETYADGAPELAPATLWPEPVGGFKLRHYPLAPYFKPDGERIQPRCFRSTNMMVNLFGHFHTRRETTGLSPHWHDDFEQASLCFDGTWMHHLRYNWGADLAQWVPDDHAELATPSVIVIPAKVIHTSRDIGEDGPESSLYDIFSPPRMDFASKPGFVLNEAEYPLPAHRDMSASKTGGTLLDWQKPT